MKFVNVREFATTATRLLKENVEKGEKVVITRHGKPVGFLIPYTDKVAVAEILLEEAESLLKDSGITEVDLQESLKRVRERLYV